MELFLYYVTGGSITFILSILYKYLKIKYQNIERKKENWVLYVYQPYSWWEYILIISFWPLIIIFGSFIIIILICKSILDLMERYFL